MEFRGIRRVNKPQSGLFSSHYNNLLIRGAEQVMLMMFTGIIDLQKSFSAILTASLSGSHPNTGMKMSLSVSRKFK